MNIWSIFDLVAPCCLVCGLNAGRSVPLCRGCREDLPAIASPCPACSLPVPDGTGACAACRVAPPLPGIVVAATAYGFPVDHLVQQLKFNGCLPVARVFGELLADAVRARYAGTPHGRGSGVMDVATAGGPGEHRASGFPAALVPVPLHAARLRQRGFNQAGRIAARAGSILQVPVLQDAVVRCRDTPAQSGLDLQQRQHNLQTAFRVTGELPAHIAIVDDVVTTGSTLRAIAAALQQAGVTRIDAWTVARTL